AVTTSRSCGRVPLPQERDVVTAPQVTVAPPDGPDAHVGGVAGGHIADEPGELAGRAVVLAADGLPDRGLVRRLRGRHPLDEQPHPVRVRLRAVERAAGTDDVVAEHALDVGAGRLVLLRHERRAVESL